MDNRQNIMDQALRLFAAKGYEAVGVEQIARAARVTKPTLYHYFGSKAGLLDELLQVNFLALLEAVRPAADYQGDLPLTLYRLAGAYFDFAKQNPEFYRLQLSLWLGPHQSESSLAVRPWAHRQQTLLVDLFLAAARDHGNMKGRQQRYAVSYLGQVNTFIGLVLNGFLEPSDGMVFNLVHQFMHGIYS